MKNKFITDYPNFSIVMPDGCNASCDFCFYKENLKSVNCSNFLDNLKYTLENLPKNCLSISITGGEPTLNLSKLKLVLDIISKVNRYFKVVLTTNGHNLKDLINANQFDVIEHVNISRHHYIDFYNELVFGTKTLSKEELKYIINRECTKGKINFNCVLSSCITTQNELIRYIDWAKSMNIYSIFLRKQNDAFLKTHPLQSLFDDFKTISEESCAVCYSKTQLIRGCKVTWKVGLNETNKDGVYELIYQPNGKITTDWKGEKEFIL